MKELEYADQLGLFGESATNKRLKYLAHIIVGAQGNKKAIETANRIMKDLDR